MQVKAEWKDAYHRWSKSVAQLSGGAISEDECSTRAVLLRSLFCCYDLFFQRKCAILYLLLMFLGVYLLEALIPPVENPTWLRLFLTGIMFYSISFFLYSVCFVAFVETLCGLQSVFQRIFSVLKASIGRLVLVLALSTLLLSIAAVFILPALYFFMLWIYVAPYVVYFNSGPIVALKQSMSLVKDRWLMVAATLGVAPLAILFCLMTLFSKLSFVSLYLQAIKYLFVPCFSVWYLAIFWTLFLALNQKNSLEAAH